MRLFWAPRPGRTLGMGTTTGATTPAMLWAIAATAAADMGMTTGPPTLATMQAMQRATRTMLVIHTAGVGTGTELGICPPGGHT
mmetsp:Transcript_49823/g.142376  ORF Transcript_49823/g.142376 Transcript_49823/m.142376 type:complete len:84 (+) Transcript_49823:396-647(+)